MTASTASELAARYVGRRTVLVVGGMLSVPAAVERPLVAAGVEVHVVTSDRVTGPRPGVASYNVCDLDSVDAIDAAMQRIGAVVQNLFHCVGPFPHDSPSVDTEWRAFCNVAAVAKPLMPVGGSIIGVGRSDPVVDAFVREHARGYASAKIRLTTVPIGDALDIDYGALQQEALEAGAPGLA